LSEINEQSPSANEEPLEIPETTEEEELDTEVSVDASLEKAIETYRKLREQNGPLTEEELKCQFANNLIKNGYVTVENGRSKITPAGKEYFDLRTKIAEANVKLTMLKNLKHRKSSKNKKNNTEDKK